MFIKIATIAEELFPYNRNHMEAYGNDSDHMETSLTLHIKYFSYLLVCRTIFMLMIDL